MKEVISNWFQRYLSDPEAVILFLVLAIGLAFVLWTSSMLAPVFAGIVIAYLLEGLVYRLDKYKCPHWISVSIVFLIFMSLLVFSLFLLLPLLIRQMTNLFAELPSMISHGQYFLMQLPKHYPEFVSPEQVTSFLAQFKSEAARFGQRILSFSIASIPSLIGLIVYLVLVPLLVFFFLLDRDKIICWFVRYLPEKRNLMNKIWSEVDVQLGKYVRGKGIEILIVGLVTYFAFLLLQLKYAALLSFFVGISVLIPFIGVIMVTVPIVIMAFLQWGWTTHFAYLMAVYAIICLLDANVLVPILFSEAVNLHPVAIIVAILFFGGLWGFWGIFFAIPLATFVQAVVVAWPRKNIISE